MTRLILLLALAGSLAACANGPTSPTTVTPPKAVQPMAYAINVPSFAIQAAGDAAYPTGVKVSPLEAQRRWDYSGAYGGTPNVYLGEQTTPCQNYLGTSVVIAPRGVAGLETFTSLDWPGAHLDPGVTYEWVGQFTFARVATPTEYVLLARCAL